MYLWVVLFVFCFFMCLSIYYIYKVIKGTNQHPDEETRRTRSQTRNQMSLFELEVSLDICPRLGLLYYMRTPFYVFEETTILFFIVAAPNYFPNNIVGGFSFIHTLSSIHLQTLMVAILTNVKCYLIVVLTCISVIFCDVEHLFMYLMAICMYLWRNVYFGILPIFFNWVVCFVIELIIYFR